MANGDIITMQIRFTPAPGVKRPPLLFESTSDMGITLLNGVTGIGIAPVDHATKKNAVGHGSSWQGTRLEEREIYLPLLIDAPDVAGLDKLRDSIIKTCDPLQGEGTISVRRMHDGKERHIPARYKSGLEGKYDDDYFGEWQTLGLIFLATEAFWSGDPVTLSWPLSSTDKPFISETVAFFPVVLGRTNVNGVYEIDLLGDAPAAPVWEVTGPATDITILNQTTGDKIFIAGEVKPGEKIRIDTANNFLSGSGRTEDELWDSLSLDSTLFKLPLGKNRVQVIATGLTKQSSIAATYAPQYYNGY